MTRFITLLAAIFVMTLANLAFAQEPESGTTQNVEKPEIGQKLSFRYWMVPAGKIEQWPWGNRKYCPVKSTVFDKWIGEFEALHESATTETFPGRVEGVRLHARLEGDSLVDGTGSMSLSLPDSKNSPISISPFSFAWHDFRWDDKTSATVALAGDQTVRIEPPLKELLSFHWSLRGKSDRQGNIVFDMTMVSTPVAELTLDIPIEYVPKCSVGIVRELKSSNPQMKRWICYPGGRKHPKITVTPVAINTNIQQKTGYQQEITGYISLEGVSVSSRFVFARPELPIHSVSLVLDRPLQVTSIEWENGQPVSSSGGVTDQDSIRFNIPFDRTENVSPVLRVNAFMPFEPDRLVPLPRIRVLSEKILWKETQCRLAVAPNMIVTTFRLDHAVQAYMPLPLDSGGASPWFFKYFASDASVSVACSELGANIRFDAASDVLFLPEETVADTVLKFRPDNEYSQLQFGITPGWEVETVQSDLREELVWEYVSSPSDKKRSVRVYLKKPFTRNYSFPLRIRSRRSSNKVHGVAVDALSPLDPGEVVTGNHYIRLRSESPFRVKVLDWSGIPYETPLALQNDATVRQFLTDTSTGTLMTLGDDSAGCTASLEKQTSGYTATLSGHVHVENEMLQESWTIKCIPPTGSRIDRVLVAFCQSPSSRPSPSDKKPSPEQSGPQFEWKWSLVGEDQRAFDLHELGEEELKALSILPRTKVWELRLQTSRSVPFDIDVTRAIPPETSHSIPLVYLPEIPLQRAEILVESSCRDNVSVDSSRMSRIPVRLPAANEREQIVGAFSYNPETLESAMSGPAEEVKPASLTVVIRKQPEAKETMRSSMWCWFLNFDSQHDSKGIVRNHVLYYLENHGNDVCRLTLPAGVDFSAVHAVGIDEKRVTWYPESAGGKNIVRVQLPSRLRFLSLFLEYHTTEEPLRKERRLFPNLPKTDFAVLDGRWRLWFPPEWRAEQGGGSSFTRSGEADFIAELLLERQTRTIRQTAEYLLTRLGDEALFKQLLTEKRRNESETPLQDKDPPSRSGTGVESSTRHAARSGSILTWGDVFTNPLFSSKLFPESQARGVPSIYIDRFSLNRSGIVPSSPIRWQENSSLRAKGLNALENAGLVLILLNSNTLYITSVAFSVKYRQDLIPICGDCVWYPRSRAFADELANSLSQNKDSNAVPAWFWRTENIGSISPWVPTFRGTRLLSETPRWNACEFPLAETENGVVISNLQRLIAQKWFFFIAVLAITCRRPRAGSIIPFFLVLLVGMSGTIACVTSSTRIYHLEGILYGALFSLALYTIRSMPVKRTTGPAADIPPESSEVRTTATHDSGESSVPGFVSIPVEPESEPKPTDKATLESSVQDATHVVTDDVIVRSVSRTIPPRSEGRIEPVMMSALAGMAMVILLFLSHAWGQAAVPVATVSDKAETGKTSSVLPANRVASQPNPLPTKSPPSSKQVEPWRVFVPVDENRKPLENYYYWIPEEFYEQLRDAIGRRQNAQNQWSISEAKYVGAVNYNSTTGTLSLFHLKATYKIRLESNQATISLPMMPLLPDGGARFDRQPIVPLYEERPLSATGSAGDSNASENTGQGNLVFEISNSTPGEHILELSLSMPQFSVGQGGSIAIPPVPNARLELTIPPDAPRISVLDSCGVVTTTGGKIMADLGPTNRLSLVKSDESGKTGATLIDVEQLFRIHARSNQTDLHARFIYRISGGKVKTLYLQHDPRYIFSGQCTCNEAEIESVEADSGQNELVRVTFRRPVSGMLVLSTNYVVQGFSGVGQIRLPRIRATQCRVTRSWIGLTESTSVKYVNLPPGDVSARAFQSAWGDADNIVVRAAYDMLRPNPGWLVSIQLKADPLDATERLALAFRPSQTVVDYLAHIRGMANVFRYTFKVDPQFVPESVAVFDENNSAVETPEYYRTPGRLYLLFRMPLTGKHSIRIRGKTKSVLEKDFDLPILQLEGVAKQKTRLKIYRSPSLYLDFSKPIAKAAPDSEHREEKLFTELTPSPIYIGDYYLEENDSSDSAPFRVRLRFNRPQVTGRQQTILFQRLNLGWEAAVLFSLDIRHGELDAFELELDELCAGPIIVEPSAMWQVIQTDRKKVVRIQPNALLRGKAEFQLYFPLTANTETLRLPRIGLIDLENRLNPGNSSNAVSGSAPAASGESSPKPFDYTTVPIRANIERYIFLPLREQNNIRSLQWDTLGLLKLVTPPGQIAVGLSQGRMNARGDNLFSEAITRFSGMTRSDFQQYQVVRNDYTASIVLGTSSPRVVGAEYLYCLHADGSLSGNAVMDLRVAQKDHCFLVVPPKYNPLEISVDGLGQSPEIDSRRRVRIELNPQRYSQRIGLAFHIPAKDLPASTQLIAVDGRIPPDGDTISKNIDPSREEERDELAETAKEELKAPRKTLSNRLFESHRLFLPRLDNIPVDRLYWICSIEYNTDQLQSVSGPCLVRQRHVGSQENASAESSGQLPGMISESDWRLPLGQREANPILLSIDYEKMEHLLKIFESGVGSFSAGEKDLQRWYARWLIRWWTTRNEVESLLLPDYAPGAFSNRQKLAIFQRIRPKSPENEIGTENLAENVPERKENIFLRHVSLKDFRELFAAHQKLIETWQLQPVHDSLVPQKATTLSPFAIWRLNHSANSKYLFGLTDEDVNEIELFVPKRKNPFPFAVLRQMFFWLLMTAFVLYLMRAVGRYPFIQRNVHYISILVGLYWIWFLTPSFVGWMIMILGFKMRYRAIPRLTSADSGKNPHIAE